ncbi:MAG: SAM-dependent methyltransferase [Pirellulaceae bacterium]
MQPDEQWRALKSEIERTVSLTSTTIVLGEREFTWYRVAEPDQLLEVAVTDAHVPAEELDPFWSVTWRAAQGLDRFLGQYLDSALAGKRVLELGCGSGQAGTGAAARGAIVTMTDAVPLAIQVAQLNAWPVAEQMQFLQLKWGSRALSEPRFPIVIGSDLVYDTSLFSQLEACVRQHICDSGRLYLSEPYRHTGDLFSKWIVERGWQTCEHEFDLQDGRVPIRVFECWLR